MKLRSGLHQGGMGRSRFLWRFEWLGRCRLGGLGRGGRRAGVGRSARSFGIGGMGGGGGSGRRKLNGGGRLALWGRFGR